MGPLDDARYVRYHEIGTLVPHHAEIGDQGREGVVRDLGPGAGDLRNQCGFSCVWEPHETHVGQEFQHQLEGSFLSLSAGFTVFRSLPGGGDEPGVSPAAPAAPGSDHALPCLNQVGDDLAGLEVPDLGAHGHMDDKVFPDLPVQFLPLPC